MAKRSKEEWQELIAEQAQSGLSAATFCRERGVNAKYFCLRRKQLSRPAVSAFVPVQLPSPSGDDIRLDWQGMGVRLPASTSPQWVAEFIKQLTVA